MLRSVAMLDRSVWTVVASRGVRGVEIVKGRVRRRREMGRDGMYILVVLVSVL